MSFDLVGYGSYGSGKLGDVTDPTSPYLNAYASIENTGSTGNKFLLTPISNSQYQSWDNCVGCQVLIHAVIAKDGNAANLGGYMIATITAAENDDDTGYLVIHTDKSLYSYVNTTNYWYWQAVLIPEFKNLTLTSKSIKPDAFKMSDTPLGGTSSVTAPCGGVLVFKCSDTLTLNGGHIDLRNAGLATNISTTYRPNFSHETNGTLDTDTHSGSENSITKDHLVVNAGDGACLIFAKTITCSSGSSRIGNPSTSGVQYCRGASDSKNLPSGVSNLGGSTISIITHGFNNFTPALIAKYRSTSSGTGRGLARAYLAVLNAHNDIIPDEGLYALDVIKRTERVKSMFNITGFGNGSDGNYTLSTNAKKCWNSYARVTAISGRVYTISRYYADVDELTDFTVGRLVMIHQSRKSTGNDWQDGRFFLSRITAVSGSTVTIKHNFSFNLSTYNVQMVVVPEFNNLTFAHEYKNTPQYYNGAGGIFAIAVNGTCNLSSGKINLHGKGTFKNIVNTIISNYQMKGALPIGQGHGSVFILARNLTLNTSTRLGATYDGSQFGGRGGAGDKSNYPAGGGWSGTAGSSTTGVKEPGWGGGAGIHPDCTELCGGWHSNAGGVPDDAIDGKFTTGCQGAHILIVADTINGLCLHALSTGGGAGLVVATGEEHSGVYGQRPGGCGYGGGGKVVSDYYGGAGGFRGGGVGVDFKTKINNGDVYCGGGGGAGACFCYCNNAESQNATNLVVS